MLRYSISFSVSQVARMLKVSRSLIPKWTYTFSEYMDKDAVGPKGTPRKFSLKDVRILAFVAEYWEDQPDIESIKYRLNNDGHYHERFDNFMLSITPLFCDVPENLEEYPDAGVVFAGMSPYGDIMQLAHAYKEAGDILISSAFEAERQRDLICPILYNYRHAIELYLKAALGNWEKGHDCAPLYDRFKKLIKDEYQESPPDWFETIVLRFNDLDSGGTTFRYGNGFEPDEVFVDLHQLKTLMKWFSITFKKIEYKQLYGSLPDHRFDM